jgi:purine-cytosine permease-like protein
MKILESIAWIVLGFVIVFIFMELVRRLRMPDASKSETNEASNHNSVSPLSIQSLPWSPLFISAMREKMKHVSRLT